MSILEFVGKNPGMTFIILVTTIIILGTINWMISLIINFFLKVSNGLFRSMNIRKHGWPPPHCDADGDFKDADKDFESEDGL